MHLHQHQAALEAVRGLQELVVPPPVIGPRVVPEVEECFRVLVVQLPLSREAFSPWRPVAVVGALGSAHLLRQME
jgi:hypothetical protein